MAIGLVSRSPVVEWEYSSIIMNNQLVRRLAARLLASAVCGWLSLPAWAGNTNTPPGPTVRIIASDPFALEGSSSGAFTFVRTGDTSADLGVDLSVGGTAVNGVDYAMITNHFTIPAGFAALDVVVQPLAVPLSPDDKTVQLTLVASTNYTVAAKKSAVVTIVENRFNALPPTVQITSPTNGAVITAKTLDITAVAADQDDSIQSVSFFDGDHLLGNVTNAPYTLTWTNLHVGPHALFARATDAAGLSAFSKAVNISVSDGGPTVQLTSPTNGAVFGGGPITLTATATAAGGSVATVGFWANGRPVGTASNAPYSVTWTNVPPGGYVLVARAVDGQGFHADSAPVAIRVTNAPPVVTLTSPTNGTVAVAPAVFTLTATASDPDGSVRLVSFYANDRLLGRSASAPYTYAWSKVPAGKYTVTAVATDNQGGVTVSSPVKVQVNKAGP